MKIRALRRHRYFKRLGKQIEQWMKHKNDNVEMDDPDVLCGRILGKRVRLVEDQISYEQLYSPINVFSEDENTVSSYRSRRLENADKREL